MHVEIGPVALYVRFPGFSQRNSSNPRRWTDPDRPVRVTSGARVLNPRMPASPLGTLPLPELIPGRALVISL